MLYFFNDVEEIMERTTKEEDAPWKKSAWHHEMAPWKKSAWHREEKSAWHRVFLLKLLLICFIRN